MDLRLVQVPRREERPHCAVDGSGDDDLTVLRLPLAAGEGGGDTAEGVLALAVVDLPGQKENADGRQVVGCGVREAEARPVLLPALSESSS